MSVDRWLGAGLRWIASITASAESFVAEDWISRKPKRTESSYPKETSARFSPANSTCAPSTSIVLCSWSSPTTDFAASSGEADPLRVEEHALGPVDADRQPVDRRNDLPVDRDEPGRLLRVDLRGRVESRDPVDRLPAALAVQRLLRVLVELAVDDLAAVVAVVEGVR